MDSSLERTVHAGRIRGGFVTCLLQPLFAQGGAGIFAIPGDNSQLFNLFSHGSLVVDLDDHV
ncbi:hypothetical protein D3C74_495980 [compost metagenome]